MGGPWKCPEGSVPVWQFAQHVGLRSSHQMQRLVKASRISGLACCLATRRLVVFLPGAIIPDGSGRGRPAGVYARRVMSRRIAAEMPPLWVALSSSASVMAGGVSSHADTYPFQAVLDATAPLTASQQAPQGRAVLLFACPPELGDRLRQAAYRCRGELEACKGLPEFEEDEL